MGRVFLNQYTICDVITGTKRHANEAWNHANKTLDIFFALLERKAVKVIFPSVVKIRVIRRSKESEEIRRASELKRKFIVIFFRDLSYNHIDNLTDTLFCCVKSLQYL